jgi:hypothetical protein
MMNRSSKAITLVLVGTTAALAGFGVLGHNTHPAGDGSVETSDFGSDEQGLVGGTQPSTRPGGPGRHFVGTPGYSSSRTYSSSRYRSTPFGGSSGSSGTINRSSSSSSSSGSSSSHGSGTSRGGFGSSGHAASSGS